ncbi:uncharacterized protein MELLADRAFT_86740 [Melampsora larici-populina 98AG31]|uniref:Uncharacterized protein n=1 Tax=Melampsora larici-populina (strain 98AG31 / pathotype 3-4-7) TaxID=747676 RepID=F4R381_MELLP|nr:uncharacterized protein MELLADRAFT_86740 [Melampsora larici-populina 98AG31]EGG12582.1 hypothetical protein MELLADRAFT_86740 [Melampsora larici-populina 98AG31]
MSIDTGDTGVKDPLFFALAGLPDFSQISDEPFEDDDEEFITTRNKDPESQVLVPKIHPLSEAEEQKYRPLFNKLVDVDKVHKNLRKPDKTESTATLQRKSLAAFRSAHHDFATVCQRFHIHYHLTAVSCDIDDGWEQAFSTNKTFSEWANKNLKFSTKFKLYVHGKEVAQEIEKKPPQPVDARRGELTRELNRLMGEHMPGKVFPKSDDPASIIRDKGWPIRLVLSRPASSLLPEELESGFRCCDDSQKKRWLSDIKEGHFFIEKIPPSELPPKQKTTKKNPANKRNLKLLPKPQRPLLRSLKALKINQSVILIILKQPWVKATLKQKLSSKKSAKETRVNSEEEEESTEGSEEEEEDPTHDLSDSEPESDSDA